MTNIDTSNVTTGAPVEGACCYTSFAASPTLPSTAAEAMDSFDSVGEISENGYTKSVSVNTNKFKGWHGSTILTQVSDEENTFKVEFVEVDGAVANKIRYGSDKVQVDENGKVTAIDPTVVPSDVLPLIFDELLANGRKRRTVFPRATIESIDDEAHAKGSLLVYGMTFSANVDDQGRPYYIREAAPADEGGESGESAESAESTEGA